MSFQRFDLTASQVDGNVRRRFLWACALALFSLLSVLCLPEPSLKWVVRYLGYYVIAAILIAVLFYSWRAFKDGALKFCYSRREFVWGILSVSAGCWVVFAHATHDYKIAMDDYLLASTAKSLHETREVSMTSSGVLWGDSFVRQSADVDKRPWLYPFCVAVLHDIFGYSPSHPFWFNSIVCVLFLGLVYIFGYWLGGRSAGVLSVLLWASLPLLSQNATGAGMEMLNLFLLQALCVLSAQYLSKPNEALESLLSLTGVMLTYTRYESGLFVFAVIIVICLGWWRARQVFLGWGTVFSSVALIAVAVQIRIYSGSASSWELRDGVEHPFGFDHLLANIPHAIHFFLSEDGALANSLLLGLLALPAILIFCMLLRTELKVYWNTNPSGLVVLIIGVFISLQLLITLAFHAGQLDQRFVSRYSLPFHVLIVSATMAVVTYAGAYWRYIWLVLGVMTSVFLLAFTLPHNSRAIFNHSNFAVRELNWLETLATEELPPRSLFLVNNGIFWSLNELPSARIDRAQRNLPRLMQYLDQNVFSEAYVVRRAHYSAAGFTSIGVSFDQLNQSLSLELVEEKSFRPLHLTQVYRVLDKK